MTRQWSVGDQVRIVAGPFKGMTGQVENATNVNGLVRVVVEVYSEPKPIDLMASQLERWVKQNLN